MPEAIDVTCPCCGTLLRIDPGTASVVWSERKKEPTKDFDDLVNRAIVPDVLLPAHSAALGITFYDGNQFPQRYRNGGFVALHGSRYDRATPAEREYMHAMADLGGPAGAAVGTAEVAVSLGRKPASLSPARDSLIKKGLVYSAERGQIAFTVPHFGRYLLSHAD